MNLNIQDSNSHNANNTDINNLYLNESIISNLNYANTIDLNQSTQSCLTEKDELDCNYLNENTTISANISNNDQNFTEKLKCWAVEYKIKQNALDALLGILQNEKNW